MTPLFSRGVVLAFLLLALGCSNGPRRASVSGTINVDGKPLERGVITFVPVNGTHGPGTGGSIEDGRFELDETEGPVVGSNRVEIRGFRKTGKTMPNPSPTGGTIAEERQVVPPEFNEKSTLVRDIKEGGNELNFDLPGIPPPPKKGKPE
jgi:hypothetical protein